MKYVAQSGVENNNFSQLSQRGAANSKFLSAQGTFSTAWTVVVIWS
jgi:hypothetical protein